MKSEVILFVPGTAVPTVNTGITVAQLIEQRTGIATTQKAHPLSAFIQEHKEGLRVRFLRHASVNAETGCWDWTGAKDNGYGYFTLRAGRPYQAHRAAYEIFVGPIPEGLSIDHRCGNRGCVNPEHLEPMTHAENMRRMGERRRGIHCSNDHERTLENTMPSGKCRPCNRDAQARSRARHKALLPQ